MPRTMKECHDLGHHETHPRRRCPDCSRGGKPQPAFAPLPLDDDEGTPPASEATTFAGPVADLIENGPHYATIYTLGAFGLERREVKSFSVVTRPWAQYPRALHVNYKEPRQRNARGFVIAPSPNPNPFLVVLDGHGHVDPADPLSQPEQGSSAGVTTRMSRHSSFAPEWRDEANDLLDAHLATLAPSDVLFDSRKGW